MDGTPYKCDSGVMVNIKDIVTEEDSITTLTDGTVWNVNSAISKMS